MAKNAKKNKAFVFLRRKNGKFAKNKNGAFIFQMILNVKFVKYKRGTPAQHLNETADGSFDLLLLLFE